MVSEFFESIFDHREIRPRFSPLAVYKSETDLHSLTKCTRYVAIIPSSLKSTLIFSILLSILCPSSGANVLFIPTLEYSHCNYMRGLGEELVRRGHSVAMYLCKEMDFRDCPGPNIDVITYSWSGFQRNLPFKKQLNKDIFEGKWHRLFEHIEKIKDFFCELIESDQGSVERLRQRHFDFAVIDGPIFTRCLYLIPYNLTIPYAIMSSVLDEIQSGQTIAPGFFPNLYSDYTSDMSFVQRIFNTLFFVVPQIAKYSLVGKNSFKLAPSLSAEDLEDLYQKSELFIENADIIMNYPKPLLPNYIQVGGLTTRPAKPLPTELKTFFDQAKHGVIVVSFGSVFEDEANILTPMMISVLSRIPQRVLLKASKKKDTGNMKIVPWLPLNDVLAHPNTRLLIYHCGNNGHFESIYHGIPLVCLPMIADQFQIAKRVEYFGMGVSLDVRTVTKNILYNTVTNILENSSFTQQAKTFSKIFRSRSKTPSERAADAMEEVMQFGGRHLRSDNAPKHWFRLLHLDIWAFFLLVLQFNIFFVVWCAKRLLRRFLSENLASPFTIFMYAFVVICASMYFYV